MTRAKDLNTRLVAAESKASELQKKYDESKRGYLRIREERERLKADLEKAKAAGSGGGADGQDTAMADASAQG